MILKCGHFKNLSRLEISHGSGCDVKCNHYIMKQPQGYRFVQSLCGAKWTFGPSLPSILKHSVVIQRALQIE